MVKYRQEHILNNIDTIISQSTEHEIKLQQPLNAWKRDPAILSLLYLNITNEWSPTNNDNRRGTALLTLFIVSVG